MPEPLPVMTTVRPAWERRGEVGSMAEYGALCHSERREGYGGFNVAAMMADSVTACARVFERRRERTRRREREGETVGERH